MRKLFNLLVPVSLALVLAGIIVTAAGIGLELFTSEPIHLVMITVGGCLVAGGIIYHCWKRN